VLPKFSNHGIIETGLRQYLLFSIAVGEALGRPGNGRLRKKKFYAAKLLNFVGKIQIQ
jgi:hypothetical protein